MIDYLIINKNNIKELITNKIVKYNKNKKLEILSDIKILKINLKGITTLVCEYRNLKYLNISKLNNLKKLCCDDNQLKELNLTNNINLKILYCNTNPFKILNLNNNNKIACICIEYDIILLSNNPNVYLKKYHKDKIMSNKKYNDYINELKDIDII